MPPNGDKDVEDPEKYQQGVMADDNSLDPSEFEEEDEHFADEGDVDFSVVPTSSSDSQYSKRMTPRNKKIVLVVLLGIVVALAVIFSGGKDTTSTQTPPAVSLEEPPPDLNSTCSPKALADDGKEPCLENCERAECCDFPANLPLSCLEGNQQKCLVYHAACSHLDGDSYDPSTIPSSVPPAPANLNDLCTPASLRTVDGFTGCHEACKHAECCYEQDVGTCQHDECSGYAPCLTLAATDHINQDITTAVNEICDASHLEALEGRAACRQACSHALCCFSPDSSACLHKDTSFCSQYTKCNELESVQPVDVTPEEIQLTCQEKEENVAGHISLCELVCQKGACCFSDDGCDDVAPSTQCSDYEPCRKVFVGNDSTAIETDDGVADTGFGGGNNDDEEGQVDWGPQSVDKESIDSACETNMVVEVIKVPDQPSLCEQVCLPGTCCFDKNVSCNVDDPERFCTMYSACSKLHPNDEEENENPPVNEQALKEACQKQDLEECEDLCRQGICCYEGAVCDVPHPERFCAHFGYCDALDAEDEFTDDDEFDDDDAVDDDAVDDDAVDDDLVDGDDDTQVVDESWVDQFGGGDQGEDEEDDIVEITVVDGVVVGSDLLRAECDKSSPKCETLCQQGACCFNAKCNVDDPALFCSAFDGHCDKFFLEDDDDDDDVDDDLVVSDDNVDADEIVEITLVDGIVVGADLLRAECDKNSPKCETLCQQGACCFNAHCNVGDPALFCSAFDGNCDKFFLEDDDDDSVDDDLIDDDGVQDEGDESWVDQVGGGSDGNNEDLDESWVDQVGVGSQGGDEDEEEDGIIEIVDVNGEIVGEDVLHKACTTGSVKCETLCKQGACCFDGGCDVADPGRFCVAFGVCEKYYQGA